MKTTGFPSAPGHQSLSSQERLYSDPPEQKPEQEANRQADIAYAPVEESAFHLLQLHGFDLVPLLVGERSDASSHGSACFVHSDFAETRDSPVRLLVLLQFAFSSPTYIKVRSTVSLERERAPPTMVATALSNLGTRIRPLTATSEYLG